MAGGAAGAPRRLACCISSSAICCSLSISIIRGTTRMRKVVPAIQAARPVLLRSLCATVAASDAAFLPWYTTGDSEIVLETLARMLLPPLLALFFLPREDILFFRRWRKRDWAEGKEEFTVEARTVWTVLLVDIEMWCT